MNGPEEVCTKWKDKTKHGDDHETKKRTAWKLHPGASSSYWTTNKHELNLYAIVPDKKRASGKLYEPKQGDGKKKNFNYDTWNTRSTWNWNWKYLWPKHWDHVKLKQDKPMKWNIRAVWNWNCIKLRKSDQRETETGEDNEDDAETVWNYRRTKNNEQYSKTIWNCKIGK